MKPLPDILEIVPLTKPPHCTITVPGSKSITNRALILAALAKGKCTLRGALWADDTQVMVDSLQKLGFEVTVEPDPAEECNRTITVVGLDGEIPVKEAELHVGNAGTAARFLTALVCLSKGGKYTIRGDERMHGRPMKELFYALRTLGAKIEAEKDFLPASIQANGLNGRTVVIDLARSSQFASALILVSKHMKSGDLDVITEAQERAGSDELNYFVMTKKMISTWSMAERYDYDIEPDASSASYFVAAAHIFKGQVKVEKYLSIYQMDFNFSRLLQSLPREVSRAFDLGDSIMTLAICALFGKQPMRIIDAAKMRLQETDRIKAMVAELKRVGAEVEEHEDGFTVWPAKSGQLHGADIETYNDHRMAMCFSVLGLKVPGIRIKNPQCVSKTFPNFFEKLEQLRQ